MSDAFKTYPTDGMPELVAYVTSRIDNGYNMRNHRLRDDMIAQTLFEMVKVSCRNGVFRRNKTAVKYAILTAFSRLGLSKKRGANRGNVFWNTSVSMESDMIMPDSEGEDSKTIIETTPDPGNPRAEAQRELEKLSRLLKGKDLKIFRMMINGMSAREIGPAFGVTGEMGRHYADRIIAALRKAVRKEYDYAQSAINDLSAQRRDCEADQEAVGNPDGIAKRKGGSAATDRPQRDVRCWRKVTVRRYVRRHAPEVVRTKLDFDRPRVRLVGRAGVDFLRDLGLMRKSA